MKRVIIAAAFLMALAWPASVLAHTPSWDLTGSYTIDFTCTGGCVETYTHSMTITSSDHTTGAVVGTGFVEGYVGYDYTVTGTVSGSDVTLDIEWSLSSGLQTTNPLLLTGTIDSSGGMSGTAIDAVPRTFTWVTTAGAATRIALRTLTVSGITAANKNYDGTTAATLNTTSAALVGVIGGDTVTLSTAGATGTFDTKSPGTGKTVTVSGLTIGGADAGNYTLTQPTTTANITAKALTVSGITAANKNYDGTTAATLNTTSAALVGVVGGDTVTLSTAGATGTFDTKSAGTGKTVTVSGLTISGADAGNYTLTQPTTTANITAKALTVSGITAANKIYDGTTAATLNTTSAALVGVIGGDTVTLSTAGATGTFANKSVGTGKTVTVSGLTISGADAGNYTLTQPTTTATIIAARP